jgi:NAD(P)-dependent dehydrogenase (short-subunit alcohol dehydrogenase family)
MKVKDRVAIVTGSGQGIGKGIAVRLAEEGAIVVINDIEKQKAEETAEEIKSAGGRSTAIVADVSESEPVTDMFAKTKQDYGRVDILVNNVGIAGDRLIVKLTDDEWDRVIKVNLRSYFLCSREAAKIMAEQLYGRIVNISSRAWLGGFGQSSYSASKGAIVSLTRTLALELAKKGITVNSIAPGIIDTPMIGAYSKEIQDRLLKMQPMGKFGNIEDVAYAVLFFASDEAWYITGQLIYVCGGKSLSSTSV